MTGDLLVRGGTVVDGTGAPARDADVRIRDGVITEIGAGLAPDGETVVDARRRVRGAGVHRLPHALRPVVVVGPARRPDAPARRHHGGHRELLAVAHAGACARPRRRAATCSASSRTSPSTRSPPASRGRGSRTPSGATRCSAHGTAVNVAALIGHSNLRVYVMGDDAWTRAATPDERAQLAAVLARLARRRRARACRRRSSTRTGTATRCRAAPPTTTSCAR